MGAQTTAITRPDIRVGYIVRAESGCGKLVKLGHVLPHHMLSIPTHLVGLANRSLRYRIIYRSRWRSGGRYNYNA